MKVNYVCTKCGKAEEVTTLAAKGVYCEHTTAGNYASYLKYCRLHGRTPDSLITMCGAGLKSDH